MKTRTYAYYYSFELTGVESIDAILIAVARAGKAYHSTEFWADKTPEEPSYVQEIQYAANEAAKKWHKEEHEDTSHT